MRGLLQRAHATAMRVDSRRRALLLVLGVIVGLLLPIAALAALVLVVRWAF